VSGPLGDPTAWAASHQRAALACLGALAPEPTPGLPELVELLARPLPDTVTQVGLKYDFYRAVMPGRHAWGLTINDRHEPATFGAALERFVSALGQRYDLTAAARLGDALGGAAPITRTFGVGYDEPDQPPRLKLYFQEEPWGAGVCRIADVPALGAALGLRLQIPEWLPGATPVGVACLELRPSGEHGLKLYLGAPDALALAERAPAAVRVLARALHAACPLGETYHYLTLRLADGRPRYAMNKIYNATQLLEDAPRRRRAWQDVAALFELAAASVELSRLLETLRALGPLVIAPTATALEGRLDRADVYFTALGRSQGTFSGDSKGVSLGAYDPSFQG
jgi:hypothetical protein